MNKLVVIFFLSGFYTLLGQNNEWHKIKDLDAGYVIEFPSEPKKGQTDVPTAKGSVTMNSYTFESGIGDKNFIYMTSFSKYPESFFSEGGLNTIDERNKVLDNAVSGAVTNTKGTLVSKSPIVFNGYDGRDASIAVVFGDGQYIVRMKTVLVGFKLYIAQVIYKKGDDNNLNSRRFFDSFELINVKQ